MSPIQQQRIIRFLFFLGIVRWYNILLVLLAQYITGLYIHLSRFRGYLIFGNSMHGKNSELPVPSDIPILQRLKCLSFDFVADETLHFMAIATVFTVASAFIINYFYDVDKDLVNRPNMAIMGQAVGTRHLANLYVLFNSLGLIFAFLASFKILLFFVGFQFLCWFYSHKLQKIPFVREISSSLLTLLPLLGGWLHMGFADWDLVYFFSALWVVLFNKDVLKDLLGHRGNLIFGYKTAVVAVGRSMTSFGIVMLNAGVVAFFFISQWILEIGFASNNPANVTWIQTFTSIGLMGSSSVSVLASWLISWATVKQSEKWIRWMLRLQKAVLIYHIAGIVLVLMRYAMKYQIF